MCDVRLILSLCVPCCAGIVADVGSVDEPTQVMAFLYLSLSVEDQNWQGRLFFNLSNYILEGPIHHLFQGQQLTLTMQKAWDYNSQSPAINASLTGTTEPPDSLMLDFQGQVVKPEVHIGWDLRDPKPQIDCTIVSRRSRTPAL
jgi:hypothetical protein